MFRRKKNTEEKKNTQNVFLQKIPRKKILKID